MNGPHSLTNSNIDRQVSNRIGVYKLFNTYDGPVRYVGKSEDLARRLKGWTDEYEFFEFEYKDTIDEAYRSESALFHRHGGTDDLDNDIHPPLPDGSSETCPVCNIHG